LKHKLKLRSSYVYGCDIDSLGVDKEWMKKNFLVGQ
jgi:hypothetical protein